MSNTNITGITPLMNIKNVNGISPLSILKPEINKDTEPNDLTAVSFEKHLAKALEPVNNLQLQAADLDTKLAAGKLEYVHQSMVASEKAGLALDLTLQIRNKVIEAYQEIMRTSL